MFKQIVFSFSLLTIILMGAVPLASFAVEGDADARTKLFDSIEAQTKQVGKNTFQTNLETTNPWIIVGKG